jgi:cyanophycinase
LQVRAATVLVSAFLAFSPATAAQTVLRQDATVGPARGSLVLAGGGQLGADILERFVQLAGGANARIVVMPGASDQDSFPTDWGGFDPLRAVGANNITVLHTRDRTEADSEEFVKPLLQATAVWIPGGRQWRLADAYLNTRTHRELLAVLDRGGVIGGTSAGASVIPSYMVRGAKEGNHVVIAPGNETGFGFLRNVAVDQHLTARRRERDLLEVIRAHPDLLGIGLDEGTAIVVRGDRADIVGRGKAAFYNARDSQNRPFYFLDSGDVFDLARRRTVSRQ